MESAPTSQSPYRGKGTVRAVIEIAKREGFASLYSGLLPTIARDAPFSGIYFAAYTRLKVAFASPLVVSAVPAESVRTFGAGVCAGAVATVLTHPADVIKTRLQLKVR